MEKQDREDLIARIKHNDEEIQKLSEQGDSFQREIQYWKDQIEYYRAEPRPQRQDFSRWEAFNDAKLTWIGNVNHARNALLESIGDFQRCRARRRSLIDENRTLRDSLRRR